MNAVEEKVVKVSYNIGDRVWFIKENIVQSSIVERRVVTTSMLMPTDSFEMYQVYGFEGSFPKRQLYPSKQELLESL